MSDLGHIELAAMNHLGVTEREFNSDVAVRERVLDLCDLLKVMEVSTVRRCLAAARGGIPDNDPGDYAYGRLDAVLAIELLFKV